MKLGFDVVSCPQTRTDLRVNVITVIEEDVSKLGIGCANLFTKKELCLGEKDSMICRDGNEMRSRNIHIKVSKETS